MHQAASTSAVQCGRRQGGGQLSHVGEVLDAQGNTPWEASLSYLPSYLVPHQIARL